MRAFLTVWLKELRENFRDRRTLMTALVFGPLGAPLLFAVMMTFSLQRGAENAEKPVEMSVVGADNAPNLIAFLEQRGAVITREAVAPDAAADLVRSKKAKAVLVVPADLGERMRAGRPVPVRLYADSSDTSTSGVRGRVSGLVQAYASQIAAQRLQVRGISPTIVQPIVVDAVDVATPAGRALLILGMLSYFVVIAMLAGGMYVAIDATAGERERGSLEPLLTTAVPRDAFVLGKIFAAWTFMTMSLGLALAAFTVAIARIPLAQFGMQANFGAAQAVSAFVMLLPLGLLGASLMTVVASFTRSFREAQIWLTVLLFVPTVPIIFAAIFQLAPETKYMWIPSLSHHLMITSLLRAESLNPLHVAMSVGATTAIGVALVFVATRLYRREGILG
jgi:sodium transport system permease protein